MAIMTPERAIATRKAGMNESEQVPHAPIAAYTAETAALPSAVTAATRAAGRRDTPLKTTDASARTGTGRSASSNQTPVRR